MFAFVSALNTSILVLLIAYMIWTLESFGSIALIFFSSVLYSLTTNSVFAFINAVKNRLDAMEKLVSEFGENNRLHVLKDLQDIFEKLHDVIRNQSVYGGFQFLACIGVVFSHSAFTFYYIIRVFILETESKSPKLVISVIWLMFMLGNPLITCIANENVEMKLQNLRILFRKKLMRVKNTQTTNSLLVTYHCISRELKFTSGLIDYNYKTIFMVRLKKTQNRNHITLYAQSANGLQPSTFLHIHPNISLCTQLCF